MVPIKIECECGQHYAFDVEPVNGRMPSRVACPTCGTDGTGVANDTIARHLGPPPAPIIRRVDAPIRVSVAAATATPTVTAPPPFGVPSPVALPPSAGGLVPVEAPVLTHLSSSSSSPPGVATAIEAPVLTPSAPRLSVSVSASPAQRTSHAPTPGRPDPRLGLVDRTQAEHEARAKAMWGDSKEQIVSYLMIQSFSMAEANELVTKLFKERAGAIREKGIRKILIGIPMMCVPVVALLYFLSIHIIPTKLFGLTVMIGIYGFYLFVKGALMALAPKSEQGDVADQ